MPSTSQVAGPVPLNYATAPPRWKKVIRRILLVLLLVPACLAGRRWGPYVWHQSKVLYRQYRCMNLKMPADAVVYEEEPDAAAQLLRSSDYVPYALHRTQFVNDVETPLTPVQAAAFEPECWNKLATPTSPIGLDFFVWGFGSRSTATIFLHERTSSGGHRRLVCVSYAPERYRTFQPAFFPGMNYYASVALPATWSQPITVARCKYWGGSMRSGWPPPPLVRVYAGQPDPNDPAHFTIRYQMWGQEDVLDGRLTDDDQITLRPRHPPKSPTD